MSSNNVNSLDIFAFSNTVFEEHFKGKYVSVDELLYQFDEGRYVYKQLSNVYFKRHLRKLILNKIISIPEDFGEASIASLVENLKALMDSENISDNQFIGHSSMKDQFFFPTKGKLLEIRINKNNIAIFERNSTKDFFTTKTVPYCYNRKAGCKTFIKFLRSVLGAKEILLLQEWFGYTLIPDTRMHKLLVMRGRGRNGKSVIMLLHRLLLGILNIASIPLRGFSPNEKFLLGLTENKLLNQVEEVDSDLRLTTSVIKRYVAGGIVQCEPKFKMAKDFIPTARIEIATNHDVDFEDDSDGFKERLIILLFGKQFTDDEQNKDYIDPNFWIESGELAGVLNWSIRGLERLVRNGWKFTQVESVTKEINLYKSNLNYTADFISTYLEEAPLNESLFGIEMYRAYKAHCEHHGLIPKRDSVLSKEILNYYPSVEKSPNAEVTNVELLKNGRKIRSHRFSGIRFKGDTRTGGTGNTSTPNNGGSRGNE